MNTMYARLTGRRAWYVTDVSVWGDLNAETVRSLATETDETGGRVVYYEFAVGGETQEVSYASLTDHRGNQLPADIERPVIVVIPKNPVGVVVVGRPTNLACRLARTQPDTEDGLVDLWVVEAGI